MNGPPGPEEPAPVIACMECGGRCHRLSSPPPDEWFAPGDVVAYRCADCLERWDVVVADDGGA